VSGDTLRRVAGEVAFAFSSLDQALVSPETTVDYLRGLGWEFAASPRPVQDLHGAVADLLAVVDTGVTAANYADVLLALAQLAQRINGLADAPHGELPVSDPAAFAAEFPAQLVKHLAADYLLAARPALAGILEMASVLVVEDVPAAGGRLRYRRRALEWDRLANLVSHPVGALRDTYRWGRDDFDLPRLQRDVARIATALHIPVRFVAYDATMYRHVSQGAAAADPLYRYGLRLFLAELHGEAGWAPALTVTLAGAPKSGTRPPGIALMPFVAAGFSDGIEIADQTELTFQAEARSDSGIAMELRPGEPVRLVSDIYRGGHAPAMTGAATMGVRQRREGLDPLLLVGSADGSHVEYRSASLLAGARAAAGGRLAVFLELSLDGAAAVIRPDAGEADGFLAQLLPRTGLRAEFDVAIVLDADGLRFKGSGALDASYPVHRRAGPLDLTGLAVAVQAETPGAGLVVSVGADVKAALGPVTASIANLGLRAAFNIGGQGGNMGFAELAVGFKPPAGVGLSIDAGPVTGGGYLLFDASRGQYAGAVQLDFDGIALSAVGLLTTRLPGGAGGGPGAGLPGGYSLLVLVTGHGFTPVPLGYGFRLTGVGGLAGVNRTVAIDVLRGGLRERTLDPVLFMRDDPVPRAAQIIGALQAVFPPATGHYLFGPMATIEWGTPAVLTADLAVVLELPSPLRLVVLGRLRALLPPAGEQGALVKLRMDALGLIEFDKRQASLDASLYDSSIAGCPISGDMALRMSWGERPAFALAAGGFHPRFAAPAGFPLLRRLAISLSTRDNPRLRLEAYLALTSNTVQVGARLDLHVEAAGFALAGMASFDALVQFAPFRLDLDIAAALALMRGSTVLMSVAVRLRLTGPAPWYACGEATFRILCFKATIAFEATFGDAAPPGAPPPVAIWPLLRAALEDAGNWGAELPAGGSALATVRAAAPGSREILAHPLGQVSVRQRVVPLDRDISRFANAPPADFRRFAIDSITVGTRARDHVPTYDGFAPAQFAEMSEDERLRAPGFDRMPAGAAVPAEEAVAGPERSVALQLKTIVPGGPPAAGYIPAPDTVARLAETGAAGLARSRQTGRARYAADGGTPARVLDAEFVLASRDGLASSDELARQAGAPATDGSYSSRREAMAALARLRPALARNTQIARREEVLA
jgi:Family of unknown function (DUF6603)